MYRKPVCKSAVFWSGCFAALSFVLYSTLLPAVEAGDAKPPSSDANMEKEAVALPEMTVTAVPGQETGYSVPNATTATKTDTPIMETPVSIQIIPEQVLRDQQVTRIEQAVSNVSGVYTTSAFFGRSSDDFVIRGFRSDNILFRDGTRIDTGAFGKRELANIEQLEILKGPASILYGRIEPGGLINYVTKKPLPAPYYAFEQQFGSFDFYRTTIDATGPLTSDKSLRYRLNLAYENADSFREFVGDERWFIAPVLEWDITPRTQVRLELDHFHNDTTPDNIGLIAIGNRPAPIPKERNLGEPTDFQNSTEDIASLAATHEFNDHWKLSGRFTAIVGNSEDGGAFGDTPNDFLTDADGNRITDDDGLLIGTTILPRTWESNQGLSETIDKLTNTIEANLTGKFETWGLGHILLLGGDYYRNSTDSVCCNINGSQISDIDIFNPVHGVTLGPSDTSFALPSSSVTEWYGLFLQDQIELPYHLYALAGFRYDNADETSDSPFGGGNSSDDEVNPRGALLWRPIPWLSLYGSYVENFGAGNGSLFDRSGNPLPPETAQQWELGVKTEFLEGRFTGTFAYYDLTKQNIAAGDPLAPNDFLRALPIGEAESNGVEVDLAGEILPGWNVIANYAYTDTEIVNDSFLGSTGNRLDNVPKHGGRIWTAYTLPAGTLQGFEFGGGVTLRGQRQGNLANDFQLPGFATVDLLAGYAFKVGKSRVAAQLNVTNLLDKDYFESGGGGRSRIAPGAPRSFLGSLRFEF